MLGRVGVGKSSVAGPVLLQGSRGKGRRRLVPAVPEGVCRAGLRFSPCPPYSSMRDTELDAGMGCRKGSAGRGSPPPVLGMGRGLFHAMVMLDCSFLCPL